MSTFFASIHLAHANAFIELKRGVSFKAVTIPSVSQVLSTRVSDPTSVFNRTTRNPQVAIQICTLLGNFRGCCAGSTLIFDISDTSVFIRIHFYPNAS